VQEKMRAVNADTTPDVTSMRVRRWDVSLEIIDEDDVMMSGAMMSHGCGDH
jgi:hypothetical protein